MKKGGGVVTNGDNISRHRYVCVICNRHLYITHTFPWTGYGEDSHQMLQTNEHCKVLSVSLFLWLFARLFTCVRLCVCEFLFSFHFIYHFIGYSISCQSNTAVKLMYCQLYIGSN